ncbi:hypothetical protein FGG08_006954 [Glutinoglossum americanum]|uniref:Chitin synthase A n=1 Tax=Glutinoglossum americanum TaxID=1670608 RepID=A0A9P8KZV2_9PEZI|nr:hypothetical protein FGG08_006954 [Glutinoglossum americanum]
MAGNPYRMSTYSNSSSVPGAGRAAAQHPTQVSTTTLLNALYATYTSGQPYRLDASTSLVVNTWLSVSNGGVDGREGGTVDTELAGRAWEHARRRAEDGCVLLGSLHNSTPSLLSQFVSAMPMNIPPLLHTALSALKPFLHAVSPNNPSTPRHSALAVTLTLSLTGNLTEASISLSSSGIDTSAGLLNIPSEVGYRAFDVFYYLLTSASTPAEREFLGLKSASSYSLLKKSGTYDPPSYVPTADDAASADDFRRSLKSIGISGSALRNLLSVLTGLLKLGETLGFLVDAEVIEEVCEDVGGLLGLDPEILVKNCSTQERESLVAGIYEALVDWVIIKANQAIASELQGMRDGASSSSQDGDTVCITVIDAPLEQLGKALALRGVFDDAWGINAEMKEDGIEMPAVGSSVLKEMTTAVAEVQTELGINGISSREREYERDRREGVLEKIGAEAEAGGFIKKILYPVEGEGVNVGKVGRIDVPTTLASSRIWYHLTLHPTDESPGKLASLPSTTSAWSAGTVSRQLRAWRLPEWANRRNRSLDFTADFDVDEFYTRYAPLGCKEGKDGVESWILERSWSNGEVVVGRERVWAREGAWWEAEGMLDLKPADAPTPPNPGIYDSMMGGLESGYSGASLGPNGTGFFGGPMGDNLTPQGSRDQLVRQSTATLGAKSALGARSVAPSAVVNRGGGDYGLGRKGDENRGQDYTEDIGHFNGQNDPEFGDRKVVTRQPITKTRRIWVTFVWALTFLIPSFVLRFVGRMKRPDVRMAWREKLVLVFLIFLLNGTVVFYIIEFGRLLCPNYDKAWSQKQVSTHQGDSDFWVSHHGKVYDLSKFWKLQHSDTNIHTTSSLMQPFAGLNLDQYIIPPLTVACPHLVTDETIILTANTTADNPAGLHVSGPRYQPDPTTVLHDINWYPNKFLPRIQQYYKGDLVWDKKVIANEGQNQNHQWFILQGSVYDLKDYFHTLDVQNDLPQYHFFPEDVEQLMKNNFGTDITDKWESNLNFTSSASSLQCLENAFYVGKPDFRNAPRCQVNNYILLAFTIVLCAVILVKFLAALQLGTKRRPAAQEKFVICQVPAYTEGENSLRKALDSLTALQYDNKRKLICVICDGMIVGGGNDRPTPKIVLDILGVDPKIDPPALPFKSVGQGNEQLNYGKVYSGLYEYEGNVVPYIVVVKVGKESEQSKAKPGNRGKRDSQVLLLSFLNRVHHRSAMSPLELEMFHQINNIIGVDPELYEYVLMVDADTSVKEDSLNRLVASCANDAKVAGICGETSLENEERSWWTMIQVYEYYISHHLAKAFESLFGSVTCLPGCFCMYRLRTADKGRPLIISEKILSEYSDGDVDTLHKKNLLSLGEDRYLTTLMTKHFPYMSYKFIPDAYANTAAPETWSVLLSQRRRWINSTIHNLAELVFLPELCGFCCFSMRFVVFIDLFGTLILPATCTYLGYLIYRVATHSGQFPLISIVMIAAVYGLQAVIFIIKRQWQHIGWMIIYILAFPVYSFILPIYSFWNQDNFSWGNTRIVIGEKGHKQVVSLEEEDFDPAKIPLQTWNDHAFANGLPGRRGLAQEKGYQGGYDDNALEMDDIHSVYSSVKPASTILAGFPNQNPSYPPPRSPAPFNNTVRQSRYSEFTPYTDQPQSQNQRGMSMVGTDFLRTNTSTPGLSSGLDMTPPIRHSRSPVGVSGSRPVSTMVDFQRVGGGPDDMMIVDAIRSCLADVDLDSVTKKQVRALVEQRLQTELVGERRTFLDRQIDAELANM